MTLATPKPADAVASTGHGWRVRALKQPVATGLAAGGICLVVQVWNPLAPGHPLCPIKAMFGVDCPGCGAMRMIYSLLHGDLFAAAHYNAAALVAVPFMLWAWAAWTSGRWRGKQVRSWQHWRWSAHITLVIVLVWAVLRNLPQFHAALYV